MRFFQRMAAVLLLAMAAGGALAAAPQVGTQAPGFYRMMVGSLEITALLDGTHPFPVDEVMSDRPKSDDLLAKAGLSAPVEGSINAFLINTGSKLILVDSGAGVLYGACCGHLLDNLRAAGYQPDQVDEIYLTHLHRDHVGGLSRAGALDFPNAVVRVNRADADYWLSPANEAKAPTYLHTMFEGAAVTLAPYIQAGKVMPFDGAAELAPDIRAVPAPGHTPGHTGYLVESNGQRILFWGDVVHVAQIQFPATDITVKYDSDADEAAAERQAIFEKVANDGSLVGAAHISFPGLGRVLKTGDGYSWAPVTYRQEVR